MNGSPIYYEGNATGSFVIVETVVDTTSGPASECTRLRRAQRHGDEQVP